MASRLLSRDIAIAELFTKMALAYIDLSSGENTFHNYPSGFEPRRRVNDGDLPGISFMFKKFDGIKSEMHIACNSLENSPSMLSASSMASKQHMNESDLPDHDSDFENVSKFNSSFLEMNSKVPTPAQRLSEKYLASMKNDAQKCKNEHIKYVCDEADQHVFLKPEKVSNENITTESQIIEGIDTQDLNELLSGDIWDDDNFDNTDEIMAKETDLTNNLYLPSNKKLVISGRCCSFIDELLRGKFLGNHRDDGALSEYKSKDFPHSEEMLNMFHQVFGLKQFRHNQLEAINAALLSQDCFILMPTGICSIETFLFLYVKCQNVSIYFIKFFIIMLQGGGKSLCYMLPALVTAGITVVISPLRSLIQDQVSHLSSLDDFLGFEVPSGHFCESRRSEEICLGVPANFLSGAQDATTAHQVYMQMLTKIPSIKLLYVTPEKISASAQLVSSLENLYKRKLLARFVIDEAHCVSSWGHDFRPDYKKLGSLREKFPDVPIMALTATATPRVRIDVLHQLNMSRPKWYKGKSITSDIVELIKSQFRNKSGIIYCLSRKECDEVAGDLRKHGISAVPYHAGLSDENRTKTQDNWVNDKFKIVCATIAFGMGIDKADVRFVIHYSLPKSIEGYYQEAGRAGRDGEVSTCILYYSYNDMRRLRNIIEKGSDNFNAKKVHIDNLYKMVRYCENETDCRRVQQLEYFGEVFDKNNCLTYKKTICDNCLRKRFISTVYAVSVLNTDIKLKIDMYDNCDVTEECKAVVQCITNLVGNLTHRKSSSNSSKIVTANHQKLSLHGLGKTYSRNDAERLLRKLVFDGFIAEDLVITQHDQAVCYVKPGLKAPDLLSEKCKVYFQMRRGAKIKKVGGSTPIVCHETNENTELKKLQEECYKNLVTLCKTIARERHMQYTYLLNMDALKQMSISMPTTKEEMLKIPHVTKVNYEKFVHRFLEVTKEFFPKKLELEEAQSVWMQSFVPDEAVEASPSWMNSRKQPAGRGRGQKRKTYWKYKAKNKKVKASAGRGKSKNRGYAVWTPIIAAYRPYTVYKKCFFIS
ncbi:Bloom syndrome [Nymphon striatum]|nr:Bloom syndrome [Nymphon striatum]